MDNSEVVSLMLKRVRERVKLVDVGTGLIVLGAFLVSFLMFEVACDHFFALHRGTRMVFLVVLKIAILALLCAGVFLPLLKRISDLYAARLIEQAYPEFKNSLTSLLQAKDDPDTPPDALRALERATVALLLQVRPQAVVSTRRFTYAGYFLVCAMVVSFVYGVSCGKSTVTSLKRAIAPEKDIAPPTKTVIVSVEPGKNTPRVLENSSVDLVVKIAGRAPESMVARWQERGGERWSKSLEPGEWQKWNGRIDNVGRGVEYFITAGDTKSEIFTIKTVSAPITQKVETEWDDGLGMPGSLRRNPGGDIDAPKDTVVTVTASANNRLASAAMVTDKGEEIPMAVSPDGQTVTGKITVQRDGKYHIALLDIYGHTNDAPPKYTISCRIRPDEEPKAKEPVLLAKAENPKEDIQKKIEAMEEDEPKAEKKQDPNQKDKTEGGKETGEPSLDQLSQDDAKLLEKLAKALQEKKESQPKDSQQKDDTQEKGKDAGKGQQASGDKAQEGKEKDSKQEAASSDRKGKDGQPGTKEDGQRDSEAGQARSDGKGNDQKGQQSSDGQTGKKADGNEKGQELSSGQIGQKTGGQQGQKPSEGQAGNKAGGQKPGASGQAKSDNGQKGQQGQKPGDSQTASKSDSKASGQQGQKPGEGQDGSRAGGQQPGSQQAQSGGKQGGQQKACGSQSGNQPGAQKADSSGQPQSGGKSPGQGQGGSGKDQAQSGGKGGNQQGNSAGGNQAGAQGGSQQDGSSGQAQSGQVGGQGGTQGAGGQSGQGQTAQGGAQGQNIGDGQQAGNTSGTSGGNSGGAPGGGFYSPTAPGEDTRGLGKDIKEVVTMLDKLDGMIESGEVDDEFLKEVGTSKEGLRTFVTDTRKALKRGSDLAVVPSGGGEVRVKSDLDSITTLKGQGPTLAISPGTKIGGDEKPDPTGQLIESKRSTISLEYRDMVDDYFRSINKKKEDPASQEK